MNATQKHKAGGRHPAKNKVSFSNPFFQRTYENVQKNIRNAKNISAEEARAVMKRLCAN